MPRRSQADEDSIRAAIRDVEQGASQRVAAARHGIPVGTLASRIRRSKAHATTDCGSTVDACNRRRPAGFTVKQAAEMGEVSEWRVYRARRIVRMATDLEAPIIAGSMTDAEAEREVARRRRMAQAEAWNTDVEEVEALDMLGEVARLRRRAECMVARADRMEDEAVVHLADRGWTFTEAGVDGPCRLVPPSSAEAPP